VAALAELIAHGGTAGAVVEILVLLAVVGVVLSVWLRERRSGEKAGPRTETRLRDDDEQRL
jgi:hypothetical protein